MINFYFFVTWFKGVAEMLISFVLHGIQILYLNLSFLTHIWIQIADVASVRSKEAQQKQKKTVT